MTIEPNGYKTLKEENKEQKKIINDFREQNFELREDLGTYKNKYIELIEENKNLHQQIKGLPSGNFELENRLFTQELNEDETDDYIDSLKNELFESYLFEIKLINCIYYLYDTTH